MSLSWAPLASTPLASGPPVAGGPPPPIPPSDPEPDDMTLRKVRARLAVVIEGTTGLSGERGLAHTFRHQPESGMDDHPADSRRFFMSAPNIATAGPYTPLGTSNRRLDAILISVVYPGDTEDAQIEDIVSSDYDAISRRLLDTSLWASSTSTIISITGPLGDRYIPATIERGNGKILLTMTLAVEHTR